MKLTNTQALDIQRGLFKKALGIVGPKRKDYSGNLGPFANFYKSELFGVQPWRGALVRLSDKLSRICTLAERGGEGAVVGESLLDTFADAANYVALVLGLVLETLPDTTAQNILSELEFEAKDEATNADV